MGTRAATVERPKQCDGEHMWKKALLHLLLCFIMGFFTDFAPSSSSSWKAGPQPQLPHLAGDDTLAASHVPVSTRPPPPTDGVVVHVGDDDEERRPLHRRRL
jgi:putative beta-1,4-xylosyltransferase IRX9